MIIITIKNIPMAIKILGAKVVAKKKVFPFPFVASAEAVNIVKNKYRTNIK
jgi:hypothetical protein